MGVICKGVTLNDLIFLPIIVSTLISLFLYKNSRQLQKYVKITYPLEWEKSSNNRMNTDIRIIRAGYINDSLKHGFLSEQNDVHLRKFLKKEKALNSTGIGLIIIVFLVSAFI